MLFFLLIKMALEVVAVELSLMIKAIVVLNFENHQFLSAVKSDVGKVSNAGFLLQRSINC